MKKEKRKETKRQTLARLSGKRVTKAIAAILNCRNLRNYEMTDDEGSKIVRALGEAVGQVSAAYQAKGKVAKEAFTL